MRIFNLQPRVVDFRWYYTAFSDLELGRYHPIHSIAFNIAAWFSKTFNLLLIISKTNEPYKKLI